MPIGLVGRKRGMTRVFTEAGSSVPVTVIELEPNRITQVKTVETDGYNAIQVTIGERRASRVTKPMAGHYAKAGTAPGLGLWEFRVEEAELESLKAGDALELSRFEQGQHVDVVATSRGKGYAGVIKRHNFSSQRMSHGNSLAHRAPGSIGQNQSPGKVFKGKKMSGQMGNVRTTIQNLEVIRVDVERNVLLLKGAVPGAPDGFVAVSPTVKNKSSQTTAA